MKIFFWYSLKSKLLQLVLLIVLCSCGALRDSPKYQLSDDVYAYRQKGTKYQKVNVYVQDDTIGITSFSNPDQAVSITPGVDQLFLKKSFDVDVVTIPFKYRPSISTLPRQLTTDFNGNVFLGYRFDRFKIKYKTTPVGMKKLNVHRAVTAGVFGGLGSTAVNPWTTNGLTTDEYNGLVLSRGFAVMVGLKTLTVGLGMGWDSLTDRDKDIWIYQNKVWYGLTLGLNLN
jgi:hypothetical protein